MLFLVYSGHSFGSSSQRRRKSKKSSPAIPITRLRDEACRLLRKAVSVNTIIAYEVGLSQFNKFRASYMLPAVLLPILDHILLFVSHLSIQKLRYNTVRLYICAISYQCKMLGYTASTKHFLLNKVLKGLRRDNTEKMLRLPITLKLLTDILAVLSAVCRDQYEANLFAAAFSFAFFGFLRVGEITFSNGV